MLKLRRRFWAKVKKVPGGCWLWQGVIGRDGYGHFHVSKRQHAAGAHRVSWFLKHGRWPKKDVLHKPRICNTRTCVRPSHLYEGDDFDNCADKRIDGTLYRPPRGEQSARAVLTNEQASKIRRLLNGGSHGIGAALARRFGVGKSTITRIKQGKVYP